MQKPAQTCGVRLSVTISFEVILLLPRSPPPSPARALSLSSLGAQRRETPSNVGRFTFFSSLGRCLFISLSLSSQTFSLSFVLSLSHGIPARQSPSSLLRSRLQHQLGDTPKIQGNIEGLLFDE